MRSSDCRASVRETEGKLEPLDVSELTEELAELFEPVCEEADLTMTSNIEPSIEISGDQTLMGQAVSNLLDNAIKYTPAGGHIRLSVEDVEDKVEIAVTDTGPGIPVEHRSNVTERFVRLDSARTKQGSGLGLSLVKAVGEMHGGSFHLRAGDGDAENPGLKAMLILPKPA